MIGTMGTLLNCLHTPLNIGGVLILGSSVQYDLVLSQIVIEGQKLGFHIGTSDHKSTEHVCFLDPKEHCSKGSRLAATYILDGYELHLQTNGQKEADNVDEHKVGRNRHVVIKTHDRYEYALNI